MIRILIAVLFLLVSNCCISQRELAEDTSILYQKVYFDCKENNFTATRIYYDNHVFTYLAGYDSLHLLSRNLYAAIDVESYKYLTRIDFEPVNNIDTVHHFTDKYIVDGDTDVKLDTNFFIRLRKNDIIQKHRWLYDLFYSEIFNALENKTGINFGSFEVLYCAPSTEFRPTEFNIIKISESKENESIVDIMHVNYDGKDNIDLLHRAHSQLKMFKIFSAYLEEYLCNVHGKACIWNATS